MPIPRHTCLCYHCGWTEKNDCVGVYHSGHSSQAAPMIIVWWQPESRSKSSCRSALLLFRQCHSKLTSVMYSRSNRRSSTNTGEAHGNVQRRSLAWPIAPSQVARSTLHSFRTLRIGNATVVGPLYLFKYTLAVGPQQQGRRSKDHSPFV